jgi:oligopeptide/dipeptide ABC transporter ATP-binding protein
VTGDVVVREAAPLLEAVDVRKTYRVQSGWTRFTSVNALEGVSVAARTGKTLAIAGESGCGKSTLGRLLLGLTSPDGGEVRFAGRQLDRQSDASWREFRRSVQMVFQNPLASFNPMLTVGGTLRDALRLREDLPSSAAKVGEAVRLVSEIGLDPSLLRRHPSELSAGQLQKASIARALASRPRVVFLDEPTSALDASGRRQTIDLLLNLQRELELAYVLVSHDFHVIGALAHHVVVMYLGQIVEAGPVDMVLGRPLHPYSRALLAASRFGFTGQSKLRIRGELTQLSAGYEGCRLFHRCPYAKADCQKAQELSPVRPLQSARCWRALDIEEKNQEWGRQNPTYLKGE